MFFTFLFLSFFLCSFITLVRLTLPVTQSLYFNKRLCFYFQADLDEVYSVFFGEEKPIPVKGTDLEIAARWRYDTWRNARENCQNPRKQVQSLCAPLRPFRSKTKENFYHSPIPHALQMCTRIKIFRQRVTGWHNETVNLQRQCQKRNVGPTFVRTENLLSRAI